MRIKKSVRFLNMILAVMFASVFFSQGFITAKGEQEVTRYADTNVYISPLSEQEDVSRLLACYNKLPESVKSAMNYLGIKIYIIPVEWQSGEDLDAYSSTPMSLVGAYSTSGSIERTSGGEITKIISPGKVVCYTDMDELFYPEQLVHEVGHELEYMTVMFERKYTAFGWFPLSMSAGMNALYTSEETIAALNSIDYLTSVNILRGCTEGFAELFRLYCLKPQELKNASPKAYAYIEKAMKEFSELQESARTTKSATNPSSTTINAESSSIGYVRLKQKAGENEKVIAEYPFKHSTWIKLSKAQKLQAVESLVTYYCDDLDIDDIPKVEFYNDAGNDCAYYLWNKNILYINAKYISRANTKKINGKYIEEFIVDTIAHEVRHRYQEEHLYDDTKYGENVRQGLRTYIVSKSDLEAFNKQFIEQDAITYAKENAADISKIKILVTKEKQITQK